MDDKSENRQGLAFAVHAENGPEKWCARCFRDLYLGHECPEQLLIDNLTSVYVGACEHCGDQIGSTTSRIYAGIFLAELREEL